MNTDSTVKGIDSVWILTQQSKEFILYEYWPNVQMNSFRMNINTAVKGIHSVWILTQRSNEFIPYEY